MSQDDKYRVLHRIDEQKRYFGLTLDECVPVVSIVLCSFITDYLLAGFVIAAAVWFAIRHAKKGQGTGWLIYLVYWYLPDFLVRMMIFTKTPPSSHRRWIR